MKTELLPTPHSSQRTWHDDEWVRLKRLELTPPELHDTTPYECQNSKTPCLYHRYSSVYFCGCGELITNSQPQRDAHRTHPEGFLTDSINYQHGDTARDCFDRLSAYGLLPYEDKGFAAVYDSMSDK